jgi:hypothetical protein
MMILLLLNSASSWFHYVRISRCTVNVTHNSECLKFCPVQHTFNPQYSAVRTRFLSSEDDGIYGKRAAPFVLTLYHVNEVMKRLCPGAVSCTRYRLTSCNPTVSVIQCGFFFTFALPIQEACPPLTSHDVYLLD